MSNSGKFEFAYHILKFVMTNFLKLYYNQNSDISSKKILKNYFQIFSRNQQAYIKYFTRLERMKSTMNFRTWKKSDDNLIEEFLTDFHTQFEKYFNKDATKLYFIRHSKTKLNRPGTFLGQKTNPTIITFKNSELAKLTKYFKDRNITEVFASPLTRTVDTIKSIKDNLNLSKIILEDDLMEIDYGLVDGKNLTYLAKKYPRIIRDWSQNKDPKFPKGENTQDVSNRLNNFLNQLTNNGNKIVCSHNVVLRVLIGQLSNIPRKDWFKINVPYTEPIEVILTKDRKLFINLTDKQREVMFKNIDFGK